MNFQTGNADVNFQTKICTGKICPRRLLDLILKIINYAKRRKERKRGAESLTGRPEGVYSLPGIKEDIRNAFRTVQGDRIRTRSAAGHDSVVVHRGLRAEGT